MTEQVAVKASQPGAIEPLNALFGDLELARLEAARRLDPAALTVAYCCWENPWAQAGGVFPVAEYLAEHLKRLGEVLLLSPLHSKLQTAPAPSELETIETGAPIMVNFEGRRVEVKLYRQRNRERFLNPWVLMAAPGFFEADGGDGGTNAYVYSSPCGGWEDPLLRDSLFACAAAPQVLACMNKKENVVFHGQDWEWAALALTVNLALLDGTLDSAVVAMTLHNLFDRYLPANALRAITDRTAEEHWPRID
jgi:hypothetical protein